MMSSNNIFSSQHSKYTGAIAFVAVIDNTTEEHGIGTAFHVGDGVFITAKHVVENKTIDVIATTKRSFRITDDNSSQIATQSYINPQQFKLIDGPRFSDDEDAVDVAVFKVDLNGLELPRLTFDSTINFDINDNTFLLDDVLVIGYPPIPYTIMPIQITAVGQVNAVIDVRHSKYPHFIISSLARGGYSGGPVISETGKVIGIVTDSLVNNNNLTESGFMTILCSDAVVTEAQKHYDLKLNEHGFNLYFDSTVNIKLRNTTKSAGALNPRIPDVIISVTDIDPDACGSIECEDPELLKEAVKLLESLCTIEKLDNYTNENHFEFYSDSYGKTLRNAAFSLKEFFLEKGYIEISGVDSFEIK